MRRAIVLAICIFYHSPIRSSGFPVLPSTRTTFQSGENNGFPVSFISSRGLQSPHLSSLLADFEPVEVHVAEYRDEPFGARGPREYRRHQRLLLLQQQQRERQDYPSLTSIFQNAMESFKHASRVLSQYIESPFRIVPHRVIESSSRMVSHFMVKFQDPFRGIQSAMRDSPVVRLTDSEPTTEERRSASENPENAESVSEDPLAFSAPDHVGDDPQESTTMTAVKVIIDEELSDPGSTDSQGFIISGDSTADETQNASTNAPGSVEGDGIADSGTTPQANSESSIESSSSVSVPEAAFNRPVRSEGEAESKEASTSVQLANPSPEKVNHEENGEEPFPAKLDVEEVSSTDQKGFPELSNYEFKKKKK